jgi:hypothetical protein
MTNKLTAHTLNEKESEEVIESLLKRKASVEAVDGTAGSQEEIIKTIKAEIETEEGRVAEEKKIKETLTT